MVKNRCVPGKYLFIIILAGALVWLAACTSSPAPSSPAPTPSTLPPGTEEATRFTINLSAEHFAFDKDTISVYAGSEVTIEFNNKDSARHNVALYTDEKATEAIFVGEIITGPQTITYKFTAPLEPGFYFFRCDVHPATMKGDFIVAGTTS